MKVHNKEIKIAAGIIKKGGLVAFPTETVYGLGADALNPLAVARIFEVKRRPLNDPLIVHIAGKKDLFTLVKEIPEEASRLIEKFWPGPLTLVLKKSPVVPDIVSAGLDTVAVRMPKNSIALRLIRQAQTPIAAASANLFGRPSSTCAGHVIDDFSGRVKMILDAGPAQIGVESTVLDLTRRPFRILRPGAISKEELKKVSGKLVSHTYTAKGIRSPGMLSRHYSPRGHLILVENKRGKIEEIKRLALRYKKAGKSVGIMATQESRHKFNGLPIKTIGPGNDLMACAVNLFSVMRAFDKMGVEVIIAEGVKKEGIGLTIMDRLKRAAEKCEIY